MSTPQWTEDASQAFIDYGDIFVPQREIQHSIITEILASVAPVHHVVELCSGNGMLCEAILRRHHEAEVLGLDGSEAMISTSMERLVKYDNRFQASHFQLEKSDWRAFPFLVDAFVSSLAIHHLDGAEKQTLFRDLYHLLAPGGMFVFADIVLPTHPEGVRLAQSHWDAATRQRSWERTGNLEAFAFFKEEGWNFYDDPKADPIDKPSSLFDQLSWLKAAGFTGVDVLWMNAGHAILGGWKP
jgi:tRNA (cmo5U34)-methyltransferase